MLFISPDWFWSRQLSSPHLRLLFDESVTDRLAECIRLLVPSAEYVRELQIKGCTDDGVMKYAQEHSRIVVAIDGDFNESRYPLGTHLGIIRFDMKRTTAEEQCKKFKTFYQSGRRRSSLRGFTYLTSEQIEIRHENKPPIFLVRRRNSGSRQR